MTSSDLALAGSYDFRFVFLSVAIAILASHCALDLGGRVTATRGGSMLAWLTGGATAMGIGIWATHFVGMLSFHLPVPIRYHWPTALLSFLPALFSSAFSLFVVSRPTMGWLRASAGSLFMEGAISMLHYTGMASLRTQAMCHYSPALVTLSVLLAIGFSLLSLRLTFRFRDEAPGRRLRKAASALLMGAAVSVMHYTGMVSATFTSSDVAPDLSHIVSISTLGISGIGVVTLMILEMTLLTSLVDRLQKQTALLEGLFEQAPQAVVLITMDDRIIRVNAEFTRIFGYTPQEIHGRSLIDLIVPEEARQEVERYADQVAHGQRVDAEGVCQRKDGSRVQVATVQVPVSVPDGQIAAFAIYRDITERKQVEDALRASEEQFRTAFVNSAIGMAITNPEGRFLSVNRAFCRITGYSEDDLLSRDWVSITHPDDVERNLTMGRRLLAGEMPSFLIEKRYITPAGRVVWVRNSAALLQDSTGKAWRVIALVEDITERKWTETELLRSFEQLRDLARRLQSIREEERARVAREIHDELGQALTAIKIDVACVIRKLPAYPRQALEKAESILRLADQTILSVRRIATELRPGILDDLGLVAAVEWAAEEFAARTGTKSRLDLPENDIVLDQERTTAIFRIFQETLTNVARHADATQVEVRLGEEEGDIALEVRDNGRGIGEEELSTGKSLGILGMRERALLLGGELSIIGVPGKGTTVRLRIPRATGTRSEKVK